MTSENVFWAIMQQARAGVPGRDENINEWATLVVENVAALLRDRPPEQLAQFEDGMAAAGRALYTTRMSAALWVISGFLSDDGFLYFVLWLLCNGRAYVSEVVEDPNVLADLPHVECPSCEDLLCVATNVYTEKTGELLMSDDISSIDSADFVGERFTVERCKTEFGRLWARFRDAEGRPKWWDQA